MPKFCTNCGQRAADGDRVCSNCGTFFPWIDEKTEKQEPETEKTETAAEENAQSGQDQSGSAGAAQSAAAGMYAGAVAAQPAVHRSAQAQAQSIQPEPASQNQYQGAQTQTQYQPAGAQTGGQYQYQAPPQQPRPAQTQAPAARSADEAPTDPRYKVAGTMAYVGLIILYAIPVIGFISCLIMCFAAKNRNIRHFAIATLILKIVAALFAVLSVVVVIAIAKSIAVALTGFIESGGFSELISKLFGDLGSGIVGSIVGEDGARIGEIIGGAGSIDISALIAAALSGDYSEIEKFISEYTAESGEGTGTAPDELTEAAE